MFPFLDVLVLQNGNIIEYIKKGTINIFYVHAVTVHSSRMFTCEKNSIINDFSKNLYWKEYVRKLIHRAAHKTNHSDNTRGFKINTVIPYI